MGRHASRGRAAPPPAGRTELKSIARFRGTWARLRAEAQVRAAESRAPANAGPLAEWGLRAWRGNDTRIGVVVGEDGTLLHSAGNTAILPARSS